MTRGLMRMFRLLSSVATVGLILTNSGCTTLNNPFNPSAEVNILDVKTSEEGRFAGIRQTLSQENGQAFILYTFVDPVLTIQNRPGFPAVKFTRFTSSIRLADGTALPQKEYSLSKFLPALPPSTGGAATATVLTGVDIQMPILSSDSDIRNVVYPGNNAPRTESGSADVVLFGQDLNGHEIEVPFTTNLRFETLVFNNSGDIPITAPTPSPSPSSSPGGQ